MATGTLPRFVMVSLVGLSLASAAEPARAQVGASSIAENREAARALAERGIDLLQAGRFEEAIHHFEQAEARFHAPTHLLLTGRALEKLGRLAQAEQAYRRVVDERLPDYAPDALRDAQAQARVALVALGPRVPHVVLAWDAAGPGGSRTTLDGLSVERPAEPIPVDPGEHTLTISRDGHTPLEQRVRVVEGGSATIQVVLAKAPPAAPARPPVARVEPSTGVGAPAFVAFGVGAAGLGVGVVAGLLSLGKVSDLEEACPSHTGCSPADRSLQDSASTLGTVSTVGFVVGGLGVAAGVTLLVLPSPGAKPPRATLVLGPGAARLGGTF